MFGILLDTFMLYPWLLNMNFAPAKSVFYNEIAPGVQFSQYFVAGMIASGMVNSGFQQLAIMIPMERDAGALKRLRGTPMPLASYFFGKSILVLASMLAQTILLIAGGVAFYGLELPTSSYKWWLLVLLLILGSANSTALGIAFSALAKSGRGASAIVSQSRYLQTGQDYQVQEYQL